MTFLPSFKPPYYAVVLTSTLLLDDMSYHVMMSKVSEQAKEESGFLGEEKYDGESSIFITYWSDRKYAEAWKDNKVLSRVLYLGEQFWFQSHALRLIEVLDDRLFIQSQAPDYSSRFPYIETERGILRVLDRSQVCLLQHYVNQEKDFFAPWEPARSESYYSLEVCRLRVEEMRRDFLEDKAVTLCFLTKDQQRIVGYVNYSNIVRGVFEACHLGYSLREGEQGKGLMHEALTAGNEYMRNQSGIHRIQANYMPRNEKSAAVLARLGFVKEGIARDYLKINGQWEDHVLTSLVFNH